MEAASGVYARIIGTAVAPSAHMQLSDLQKAMLNATPDCVKVISVDGKLISMNKAGCRALGVREESGFGMPWLTLLPEDVHLIGAEALRKAAAGESARFPGKSHSPHGTNYWDNLLTPLVDDDGHVLSILCVSRDVTERTALERALEEANERDRVLAHEMRHRVRNIFSVVSGLIHLAQKEAAAAGADSDAITILRGKIDALSRASDAVFFEREAGELDAATVEIETVVRSVLQPYGERCTVAGQRVPIRRDAVTSIALLLHELATNCIKYGAFSQDIGTVSVQWAADDNVLDLTWVEIGGPRIQAPPETCGFGSQLLDRVVRSAKGAISRTWRPEGLMVVISLPELVID